jgi:hypothetical protein
MSCDTVATHIHRQAECLLTTPCRRLHPATTGFAALPNERRLSSAAHHRLMARALTEPTAVLSDEAATAPTQRDHHQGRLPGSPDECDHFLARQQPQGASQG